MTVLDMEYNAQSLIWLIIGYLISIGIGHLTIYPIMTWIFRSINDGNQLSTIRYAGAVGVAERLIYTTVILAGGVELIGGWLVLKAVLEFKTSKRSMSSYYAYLLGNALSVFFGLIGGIVILIFWKHPI